MEVSPTIVIQNESFGVELRGSGFTPRLRVELDSHAAPQRESEFAVRIGSRHLAGEAVERLSDRVLRLTLPEGLPLGWNDVSVQGGDSLWIVMPDALKVELALEVPVLVEGGGREVDAGSVDPFDAGAVDGGSSSLPPAEAGVRRMCDDSLLELAACFEFEDPSDSGTLLDSSSYANHALVSGAQFVPGVAGNALQGSVQFDSHVPDSPSLDPDSQVTLELWLHLDADVDSGRQGLVDNQGQFGFFVVATNALLCSVGVRSFQSASDLLAPGQWNHIACVYDGSRLRVYLNGNEVGSVPASGPIDTDGTVGSAVAQNSPDGDELTGKVDTLRIWGVARTRAELCEGAGLNCP